MRVWFSFPRIFGIRPGISFALSELSKKPSRKRRDASMGGVPAPDPEPVEHLRIACGRPAPLHVKTIALIVWMLAAYGLVCLIATIAARAGTCHYYSEGSYSVTACDNGSYTVRDHHGHVRQYGDVNGAFEKYPGREDRPVFERRDH
jgi:hypothetical protein